METGKGKSKLSQETGNPGQGESPEHGGVGEDRIELLSQFAQEGIALLKRESGQDLRGEDLSPGLKKGLRGVLEKYLSEWRKKKED